MNPFLASTLKSIVAEAEATRPAGMSLIEAVNILIEDRTDRGILSTTEAAFVQSALPVHTVRGNPIPPEGLPYGTTHDYDCPGCAGTSFTSSPRSETYWSS